MMKSSQKGTLVNVSNIYNAPFKEGPMSAAIRQITKIYQASFKAEERLHAQHVVLLVGLTLADMSAVTFKRLALEEGLTVGVPLVFAVLSVAPLACFVAVAVAVAVTVAVAVAVSLAVPVAVPVAVAAFDWVEVMVPNPGDAEGLAFAEDADAVDVMFTVFEDFVALFETVAF